MRLIRRVFGKEKVIPYEAGIEFLEANGVDVKNIGIEEI